MSCRGYRCIRAYESTSLTLDADPQKFYVYPGVAATATFILNNTQAGFGSLFAVGWAFGMGISFAIIICAPTSGGHFNPAFTICFAIWQGFPWAKVPYYIISQIFGAFVAALVVAGQYWVQLSAYAATTTAAGEGTVFLGGPASIFCAIPTAAQTNLGFLFMIEFFVDSFIVRRSKRVVLPSADAQIGSGRMGSIGPSKSIRLRNKCAFHHWNGLCHE